MYDEQKMCGPSQARVCARRLDNFVPVCGEDGALN